MNDLLYDDYRHIQRLGKLIAICFDCHRAIHFTSGYMALLGMNSPASYERVEKHFLRVNKIKCKTMEAHEKLAMWLYNERGNYSWEVDFGAWTELVKNSDRADVDRVKRQYKYDKNGDGIVYISEASGVKIAQGKCIVGKSIADFFDVAFSFDSNADNKIVRATRELTCSACCHAIEKGALYALRSHNRSSARACYNCLKDWQDENGSINDGYTGPGGLTVTQEEKYFQQKND